MCREIFAFSARYLREVNHFPTDLQKNSSGPDYFLGTFERDGKQIPLLCLQSLLSLPGTGEQSSMQVALLDKEGLTLGVAVERADEILKIQPSEELYPYYKSENIQNVVVGSLRLKGNGNESHVVNIESLFSLEIFNDIFQQQKRRPLKEVVQRGPREKAVSFTVAKKKYAFSIENIHEIIRVPELQHSALHSNTCCGLIHVRGEVIPVLRLHAFLDSKGQQPENGFRDCFILTFRLKSGVFGLLVDQVQDIFSFYEDEITRSSALNENKTALIQGVVSLRELPGETFLLDPQFFLLDPQIEQLIDGHHMLYPSEELKKVDLKRAAKKNVYISFRLDQLFAIPMSAVSEVIEYPSMMSADQDTHFKGSYDLRGSAVSIIDIRAIYGLPRRDLAGSKVLVFEHHQEKLGLVVDCVESILTVRDDQWIYLPKLLYRETKNVFQEVVKEALQITHDDGLKSFVIVLETKPLVERIKAA